MRNAARKVLFADVEHAELVDDPDADDAPLSPTEVEGRTLFSLISAGTENNLYNGNYQKAKQAWGTLPLVPGYAAVIEVERIGADVQSLRPGDLAFCHGKHKSWQRVEVANTLTVPAGMPPEHVPFARMMNVTMSTLTTTRARPPAKVIVTGLGLVGLLGALAFQLCGYDVTACEPQESRRNLAKRCGLRSVLPGVPLEDKSLAGQIDLVMDCSGNEQAIFDGCTIAGDGAEIVAVGVPMTRKTDIYAQQILHLLFRKYLTLRGGKEQRLPAHATQFDRNSMFANQRAALGWIAENKIPVSEMTTRISPHEAQRAYQSILTGTAPSLSYLFDWTSL